MAVDQEDVTWLKFDVNSRDKLQEAVDVVRTACNLVEAQPATELEMAGFSVSLRRWSLVILALMLCFQVAVATIHQCDHNNCNKDLTSYAPKHFVFVHGMGGGAWFWFEVITLLEHYGFSATAVDLTAHGINKAVADDVKTVKEYTQPLIDAIANISGKVILVGHSLGGGSVAYASEIFPHKISKAIYVSAVMPSYNQSMFSGFPTRTFPTLLTAGHLILNFANGSETPTSVTLNKNTLPIFYMNETPKRYVNLAKLLVTDTPYEPGTQVLPLTPAKYGKVKRYYIRTGRDHGVPPADQDEIIAANPPKKVLCIPKGDHAVFFSKPMELFRNLLCISSL